MTEATTATTEQGYSGRLMGRADPTVIVVSRHGETVWHAENRYAGSSDVDLTELGQRQAHQLAEWAATDPPDALYTSPIRRARETVAPVATALGMPAVVLDGIREVHFGIAEGRTIGEIREATPEIAADFVADPVAGQFPEAESPEAAAARGEQAFRQIAAEHPGQRVLIVAHNTFFRLTLCRLVGIPLSNYRRVLPRLNTGTLSTVRLTAEPGTGAALLSFNVPVPVRETTVVSPADRVGLPADRVGSPPGRN